MYNAYELEWPLQLGNIHSVRFAPSFTSAPVSPNRYVKLSTDAKYYNYVKIQKKTWELEFVMASIVVFWEFRDIQYEQIF